MAALGALAVSGPWSRPVLTGDGQAVAPAGGPALTPAPPRHSALPPLPPGAPSHFAFGLSNNDASQLPAGVPLDFRYAYFCGGVNTAHNWATWNPGGAFADNFIAESRARGMIPVAIYYQILQSGPSFDEFANLQNAATMRAYYDDFALLMRKAGADGGTVYVAIEPDLAGFMQQRSAAADDASLQPTAVAASGHPDVQGYPDTFRGFYQALAHLRDLYAPNVSLGLDVSSWAADDDVLLERDQAYDWQKHAARTAQYLNSLGPGYQLLFFSPLDRDAAYYELTQGQNRWWDDTNQTLPNFDRAAEWMGRVMSLTNKRALMWQVPVGNRVYRSQDNTPGHYQDNRAEYFLNPSTGRAHVKQWLERGFIGMMFGAGREDQTNQWDNRKDGVTNPAPINANEATATHADDDGGYLRQQIGAYYEAGPIALPR